MKRFLWLMCMGACTATFAVACGDDDGGGGNDGLEDGGTATPDQIADLTDQLDGLESDVMAADQDLQDQIDMLTADLDGANGDIGGLGGDVTDLQQAIEDILSPDDCSAEELCNPDGIKVTAEALTKVVTGVCQHEIDCCNENELRLRLGAGIATVEDCVNRFADMVKNGQSPDFLWEGGETLANAVQIAIAINSNDVQVGIDADAVDACADSIADWDCNSYGEEGPISDHCEPWDATEEADPCSLDSILVGMQDEGELCGVTGVDECAEGLVCRHGSLGICATPSEVGDACVDDGDCDGEEQYCDQETNACTERGGIGDPCAYVDGSFTITGYNLSPDFLGWWQNQAAVKVECKAGLMCDPLTKECVQNCSQHALCSSNYECPDGKVCNFTEIPELYSSFYLGLCTDPIADGDACTQQTFMPNGEVASTECDSERCNDIGNGKECVDKATASGGDCDSAVVAPAYDPTCASTWCSGNDKCAETCTDDDNSCPNGFYCDLDNDLYYDEAGTYYYPCEPKGGTGDTCNTANVSTAASTDYQCASGRCDTSASQCAAAKLANGDPCTHHGDCATTSFCGYDTVDARSECMAFVAANGDCSTPAAGDWACGPNSRCVGGLCKGNAGDGDACDDATGPRCETGLTCAVDGVGANGECHYGGEFQTGANCNACAYGEDGTSYYCYDSVCGSGWCIYNAGYTTCGARIAEGEDCDADDPAASKCETGFYCKHDPRAEGADIGKGKCTKQGGPGQGCNPRYDQITAPPFDYYGNPMLNVHDCANESDLSYASNNCTLSGDKFVCSLSSIVGAPACDGN